MKLKLFAITIISCLILTSCTSNVIPESSMVVETTETLETESVTTEETTFEETEEQVDRILATVNSMTDFEKICQLFIVTPEQLLNATGVYYDEVTEPDIYTELAIEKYPVSGLIYFSQNLENRQQIYDMNADFQRYSKYGLFISVDEEGGEISRLAGNGIEGMTELEYISWYAEQENSKELFRYVGSTLGSELHSLGFNLDFAPVADIEINSNNTMGERMPGSDPYKSAELVAEEVSAMQAEKVCATLKHFPGLGATVTDTHKGNTYLERNYEDLSVCEFIPFKSGIDAGAEFVMVSHAIASGLGEELPSDLSKFIVTDILRDELEFGGIIITDAHSGMASITDTYTSAEASVAALKAGVDIVLMPDDLNESVEAVFEAIGNDEELRKHIDDSVYRVLSVKEKYGIKSYDN